MVRMWQKHRSILFVWVVYLSAAACLAAAEDVALEETPADKLVGLADPGQEDGAALLERVREIQANLSALMGEPLDGDVPAVVLNRDEVVAWMEEEIDHDMPAARMAAEEDALKRFGLLPMNYDLRAGFLRLMKSQVAGVYFPRRKTLCLIEGTPLQTMVTAHELTHAIQDQRVDIQKRMDALKENDDRARAFQALVEGEACLSMTDYMMRHGGMAEVIVGGVVSSLQSQAQTAQLQRAPLVIREALLFPYIEGQSFVTRAFQRGRYRRVRRLFREPPESTEQVLHPDKYYGERDRPTTLALDGAAEALGEGWRVRLENTVGEFGARTWLQTHGIPLEDAVAAASGWDGDRFALLRLNRDGEEPRDALLWVSTWDSSGHGHRFYRHALRAIEHRCGEPASESAPLRQLWTPAEGSAILLGRWGREAILLDGFDDEERNALRHWLSEQKRSGALFEQDHRDDGAPVVDDFDAGL